MATVSESTRAPSFSFEEISIRFERCERIAFSRGRYQKCVTQVIGAFLFTPKFAQLFCENSVKKMAVLVKKIIISVD